MRARTLSTLVLSLVSFTSSIGRAEDPPKSELLRSTPVEQLLDDKSAAKIVFIAGSNFFKPGEHAYTEGCAVLMHLAGQTKGVAPVLAIDWPKKPETLAGAKAVVLFFDGAEKHHVLKENHLDEFQKLIDAGVGVTALHQGPDLPAAFHDRGRQWFGAVWEKGYSQRAHWVHKFEAFPDHAITRGVTSFQIDDGWLFRLRFVPEMKGITPLLRTVSPSKPVKLSDGSEDVVGWAYERPTGGRSFTFTGGHLHRSLAEEGYRRMLTNGVLWSAGIEVPTGGAPVELDAKMLEPVATTAAK